MRFIFPILSMILSLSVIQFTLAEQVYSSEDCKSCHIEETQEWRKSDHAKSMSLPTMHSVVGKFGTKNNPQSAVHKSLKATFWKSHSLTENNKMEYFVSLGQKNKLKQFKISYTFGIYPLQQYLVEKERGKFQVFPFAWDDRPEAIGGQRWFTQYPTEDIKTEDRLHWQQPFQNWNGMCADCHSDNLKRNYQSYSDSFSSRFSSINVDCLACHDDKVTPHIRPITESKKITDGQWQKIPNHATASWVGGKRDSQFMQACFACHALRSPLTDGFNSSTPFLEQFKPSLLGPPNYFADGQIHEEVFVYGSFLQSKMYQQGVNCLDCHRAHSLELKLIDNALCAQCHSPSHFDTPKHHGHSLNTAGALCANCHMPKTTFMGVDKRADHRFGVPKPDWTQKFGVPNACSSCHQDKTLKDLSESIESWIGETKKRNDEAAYIKLLTNVAPRPADIWEVVQFTSLPAIKRATALSLFAHIDAKLSSAKLQEYLLSNEPLLRFSAVLAAKNLNSNERVNALLPLLDDKLKLIRLEAANQLVGLDIPKASYKKFQDLLTILININDMNSWRAEGEFANALIASKQNNLEAAIIHYRKSIQKEPYFALSYINLADIYRLYTNVEAEKLTLLKAIDNIPNDSRLYYSLGLFYVRQSEYLAAEDALRWAYKLNSSNIQVIYTFALILDKNNQLPHAIRMLQEVLNRNPNSEAALSKLLTQYIDKCSTLKCYK